MKTPSHAINLTSEVPKTVLIRREGAAEWQVRGRKAPPGHDNAQAIVWLRIENPGKPRKVALVVRWAEDAWRKYRTYGYLKRGGRYRVLTGESLPGKTRFEFTAPHGTSRFGPTPWYDNDDAQRFLRWACRQSDLCEVRSIGESGEGRPIPCLKIERPRGRQRKTHVFIGAREHATESSGSFAVEAIAKHLLSGQAPRDYLRDHVFHIVPVINPDGVAKGMKLTRWGPVKEVDVYQGGRTSDDPTCRALRDAVCALRPACVISFHSYLQPTPACMFFNKRDGMAMLDVLLDVDNWIGALGPVYWKGPEDVKSVWHVNRMPSDYTLWGHCHRAFGSVVSMPELPWHGRTIAEMDRLALASFLSAMHALALRR